MSGSFALAPIRALVCTKALAEYMGLKPLFGLAPRPKGLANASHEVSALAYRSAYPLEQLRRPRMGVIVCIFIWFALPICTTL